MYSMISALRAPVVGALLSSVSLEWYDALSITMACFWFGYLILIQSSVSESQSSKTLAFISFSFTRATTPQSSRTSRTRSSTAAYKFKTIRAPCTHACAMDGSFFAPKSAWRLERAGGETVDIPSPAYIGRGIDCDVRIEDQRVSRHHVCIDHGKLTNLSTQNPVWVDGNEVPPKGTATLEHKSEIKLPGSNTFRYLSYEPQTWQRTGSYSQPREGMHIPEEQLGGDALCHPVPRGGGRAGVDQLEKPHRETKTKASISNGTVRSRPSGQRSGSGGKGTRPQGTESATVCSKGGGVQEPPDSVECWGGLRGSLRAAARLYFSRTRLTGATISSLVPAIPLAVMKVTHLWAMQRSLQEMKVTS